MKQSHEYKKRIYILLLVQVLLFTSFSSKAIDEKQAAAAIILSASSGLTITGTIAGAVLLNQIRKKIERCRYAALDHNEQPLSWNIIALQAALYSTMIGVGLFQMVATIEWMQQ